MTDALVPTGDGHTELSEDDRVGLIPTYIATRGDLFDAEQRSIAAALVGRRPQLDQLLDDRYLRDLHHAMFSNIWRWAGKYRLRDTNIGIDPTDIAVGVRGLVHDAQSWTRHTTYEPDELAVRFHHRLVAIHPFVNGNGRHGRITTDLLVTALGGQPFRWGAELDVDTDHLRAEYIAALQRADGGDISRLMLFARGRG
jgi:mobile mystery protein B